MIRGEIRIFHDGKDRYAVTSPPVQQAPADAQCGVVHVGLDDNEVGRGNTFRRRNHLQDVGLEPFSEAVDDADIPPCDFRNRIFPVDFPEDAEILIR